MVYSAVSVDRFIRRSPLENGLYSFLAGVRYWGLLAL